MDQVGLLSVQDKQMLENSIRDIFENSGPQISILIVDNLQEHALEDFAILVSEQWQLGSKESDNGVLILIAMKERQTRIEVGHGLEGSITDYDSKLMIEDILVPAFKKKKFFEGLDSVVKEIAKKVNIDPFYSTPRSHQTPMRVRKTQGIFEIVFIVILFLMPILSGLWRKLFGNNAISRGSFGALSFGGIGYWLFGPLIPLLPIIAGIGFILGLIGFLNIFRHVGPGGSSRGGSRPSSWPSSRGGPGGWSGGGGSFGGGGASGSW